MKPEPKMTAHVFLCGRKRRPRCTGPGCGVASITECAYVVNRPSGKGTCDRALCRHCARRRPELGPDAFYCATHHRIAGGQA
jgi:hypothetical protein